MTALRQRMIEDMQLRGYAPKTSALECWRAWYHFCRPHQGLRVKLAQPQARRGKQTPRNYVERTPAMAAGLTNRIWTMEEMLAYPVPAAL